MLCWESFMLSVVYAECHLCYVMFMLSDVYAECRLCWVSLCWMSLCWMSWRLSYFVITVTKSLYFKLRWCHTSPKITLPPSPDSNPNPTQPYMGLIGVKSQNDHLTQINLQKCFYFFYLPATPMRLVKLLKTYVNIKNFFNIFII